MIESGLISIAVVATLFPGIAFAFGTYECGIDFARRSGSMVAAHAVVIIGALVLSIFYNYAGALCFMFGAAAGLPIGALIWARAFQHRAAARICRNCGYNLTGNTSGVCPECGTRIAG